MIDRNKQTIMAGGFNHLSGSTYRSSVAKDNSKQYMNRFDSTQKTWEFYWNMMVNNCNNINHKNTHISPQISVRKNAHHIWHLHNGDWNSLRELHKCDRVKSLNHLLWSISSIFYIFRCHHYLCILFYYSLIYRL